MVLTHVEQALLGAIIGPALFVGLLYMVNLKSLAWWMFGVILILLLSMALT